MNTFLSDLRYGLRLLARRPALTAGRDFDTNDRAGTDPVAIVSTALARRYFPNDGAVGHRIRLSATAPWLKIVGVAADVRYREWEAARYDIYIPFQQRAQHRSDFVVRTQNPLALTGEIERAVAAVDKDQPVSSLSTVDSLVEETFALPRFNLTLVGVFAGCALLLAGTGLFALLMNTMTQRRQEIGIRMAIGARPADIVRMVLSEGVRLTAAGMALGTFAAYAATRAAASQLPGMREADAWTLGTAGTVVVLISLLAAWIPAARAAGVDPMDTLRHE